ncbi:MAG: putative signal transducing protein [Bacteroidota bacterium]|jgi:hypothetical protein|nr:DUF2007 domain-containing protein [Bacteroidia bacterium]MBP6010245.1 DUF2007 domain-containing protein [Bacteroidia bacterium]MBP7270082.1 DUF2007 domain-containing protein [Bacteroidia bacterium]MBP7437573.1 DUF2007 domain-containing protein [Bacteroidia bacterium]MBP7773068.1 DUF2007 domain-containing protein [Bacteroidia bacterium]
MEPQWERVYFTGQIHQAEIAREILEENSIPSVIIDKRDSSYLVGDIELYVRPEDLPLARIILKQHEL